MPELVTPLKVENGVLRSGRHRQAPEFDRHAEKYGRVLEQGLDHYFCAEALAVGRL